MRKLKTNILDYILIELNEKLKNIKFKFYRIDNFICECLKRDYNLKLLQRTIEEISHQYRKKIDKNININTNKNIYIDNQEAESILLLKKRFIDIIDDIRGVEQNFIKFFNKIKEKEQSIIISNIYIK